MSGLEPEPTFAMAVQPAEFGRNHDGRSGKRNYGKQTLGHGISEGSIRYHSRRAQGFGGGDEIFGIRFINYCNIIFYKRLSEYRWSYCWSKWRAKTVTLTISDISWRHSVRIPVRLSNSNPNLEFEPAGHRIHGIFTIDHHAPVILTSIMLATIR